MELSSKWPKLVTSLSNCCGHLYCAISEESLTAPKEYFVPFKRRKKNPQNDRILSNKLIPLIKHDHIVKLVEVYT